MQEAAEHLDPKMSAGEMNREMQPDCVSPLATSAFALNPSVFHFRNLSQPCSFMILDTHLNSVTEMHPYPFLLSLFLEPGFFPHLLKIMAIYNSLFC